jgi:AcrR family transcriptional regulator
MAWRHWTVNGNSLTEANTHDRILDAAEDLLRRHGPAKTNVVDVARKLGMSHANVYRHFASKAALQDAVAQRWLHALMAPLEACVASKLPAEQRLREWVWLLTRAKRRKVLDDPELFATYHALAEQSREVVAAHVGELASQIARIIGDGVASGVFRVRDVGVATRALQTATMRYHHPHFVAETADDDVGLEATLDLVIAGLKAGVV